MEEILAAFKQLGQYAAEHEGLALDTAPQETLHQQFKDWENGSNTAPDATGGGSPIVAITAPVGVLLSSPQNVISHAGQNIDLVALKNLQLSSAERLIANAGKGISLFAQSGDCRMIANTGKVRIQSQKDDTEINAAQDLKLTANRKVHMIAADEILLLTSDGSYVKLGGGSFEAGCKGSAFIRAAGHQWVGPATQHGELPTFSQGDVGRAAALMRPTDGHPMQGVSYQTLQSDGSVVKGVTDAAGNAANQQSDQFEHHDIAYFPADASGMAAVSGGGSAASAQGDGPYDEQFHLVDAHDNPLPQTSYRILASNGQIWEGVTDDEGLTQRVATDGEIDLSIEVLNSSATPRTIE